jgi:hypothetical protein
MTGAGASAAAACPGCGVELPRMEGPTHRYLASSPACWAAFGEVLAREFGDPAYFAPHALTVDTYAAQHPGVESAQTTHSAAFHLMGLCLVVERGVEPTAAGWMRQRAGAMHRALPWLEPPGPGGGMTVVDVLAAGSAEEHARLVRRWAESVWTWWGAHHERVRSWVDRL